MTGAVVAAGTAAGAGAVVLAFLKRYSLTSYGSNPWTGEAVRNVLRLFPTFEKARAAIGGRFTSVYRSPVVNAKVPGSSKTSLHMSGRACDIKPGGLFKGDPEGAARRLWAMATAGELGNVYKVIWEPTWVHISWRAAGIQQQGPEAFLRMQRETLADGSVKPRYSKVA